MAADLVERLDLHRADERDERVGQRVELVRQEADEEQKRDLKHQHHLPPVELLVVPEAHVNGLGRHGPENKGCDRDQIFQTHAPFAAQKHRAQKKDVAGPRVGKDLPAADYSIFQ